MMGAIVALHFDVELLVDFEVGHDRLDLVGAALIEAGEEVVKDSLLIEALRVAALVR